MRPFHFLAWFAVASLVFVSCHTADRVVDNTRQRTARNVENRAQNRIDRSVDRALDALEDAIDGKQSSPADEETASGQTDIEPQEVEQSPVSPPDLQWAAFDFVPGDVIIFEDDLAGEKNGEFPSRWDLVDGVVENAMLDGEHVIMFRRGNINSTGGIVPLIKDSHEDYLPDEFTIEFDAYFDQPGRIYRVMFYDGKNQSRLNRTVNGSSNNDRVRIYQNAADFARSTRSFYPGFTGSTGDSRMSQPGWRRVSISFNTRALKVYLDDARLLNIPNMDFNPLGITIGYHNPSGRDHIGYIKNIRVAQGAVPLYDKFLTDGKIITHGIRFDVNKSTIRPESMGVINEIVSLMQNHPELKFSVEGHTDSDGAADANQLLSEARARSVMEMMVSMGISTERLSATGHGESKPIAGNETPEGKAQNRRVEFVKI